MIVGTELYPVSSGQDMNCGLQQFDPRHFAAPAHWLPHQSQISVIKSEPRDEGFNQYHGGPLTPPGGGVFGRGYVSPRPGRPSTASPQPASPQDPEEDRPGSDSNLTPPGSAPSPPMDLDGPSGHALADSSEGSSKSDQEMYESGDSLKRLQVMALQRNGMIPEEKLQCPMCDFSCGVRSEFNAHLLAHETKCGICEFVGESMEKYREHMKDVHDQIIPEDDLWTEEEPGLTTPKVNSQGKVKTFKCKQCEYSAVTKLDFWEHSRAHIKRDRILTCPKCPFVTEYKHHLEYHLRNHYGSKPFKCDKCSYSCVNKSMLNSHLKSHSNVYQFRCSDCTYATKYCHSLKLHLRKYGHNPAMVLNPDGTPNPLPIVDVYGTRRGPKQKAPKASPAPESGAPQESKAQSSSPLFPYNLLPTPLPYYNILNGFSSFPYSQEASEEEEEKNNNVEKVEEDGREEVEEEVRGEDKSSPLDLSCPDPIPAKSRRKGKAFKLERPATCEPPTAPQPPPSPVRACEADSEAKPDKPPDEYNCQYCDISFRDIVMYTMHMGYHGYQDPFTCNMCGQTTPDKLAFFLHIARTSHS